MKKVNQSLTPSQLTYTVLGAMMGVGILALPNALAKISQQDAWISTILGAVYPFYICLLVIYISKKYPNNNVLFLSKKYFGEFLGSLLNLLFLSVYILYTIGVASGFTNIIRIYSVAFLSSENLLIIIMALCLYTAYKGLKLLGKISEIIFYLTLFLIILPIFSFGKGSFLNLSPVLGSGLNNILKGSMETALSYTSAEILLLVYPFVNDKKKIKNASLLGVFLTMLIYVWIVFVCIYYFGLNATSKNLWPFLSASELIDLPIINNFRYPFMLLWSFIILKAISIMSFVVVTVIKDFTPKTSTKNICLFIYPVLVFLSFLYSNEIVRRNFLDKTIPIAVVFCIIYTTSIALLIRIKG